MMIFRTNYIPYDPSWKVAVTGEGEHLGSWGRITTFKSVEAIPGSCQWICVAMVPSFSVMEFQCVVVDERGNIVEWERKGVNRKIAVKDSPVYVTLPWSLPDIYFFQQHPPKNFGRSLFFVFAFNTLVVNYKYRIPKEFSYYVYCIVTNWFNSDKHH